MPGRFITSSTIPMSYITFNSNRPSIQESLLSGTHALSSSEAHFGLEISTPPEELVLGNWLLTIFFNHQYRHALKLVLW